MNIDSAVLRLDNICKSFGGLQVLQGIDLRLERQQIIGLIGPNGAGKSTLFNIITAIYRPTLGNVYLEGNKIPALLLTRYAIWGSQGLFSSSEPSSA